MQEIGRRTIVAPARHAKEGSFLGNGGAVWFETERPAAGGGLIEGATPECRGPRQVIAYQQAQDATLGESASQVRGPIQFRLIKNDRDGAGNIYGAQENYEAVFATGWRLWLWRAALVAMFPLVLVTWVGMWLLVLGVLAYGMFATMIYIVAELFVRRPKKLAHVLFGGDFEQLAEGVLPGPVWLESTLAIVSRVWMAPLALVLECVLWLTAFVHVRRKMLAFLVSRPILAGAGMIDEDGRFHLSDKAPALNCLTGFGGFLNDRPIFTFGHFFKALCSDGFLAPREYLGLFAGRQRLQIALGDSNMAETAEFLRVGTTLLVLDALEAGELPAAPRVRQPIKTLRKFCADDTLTATATLLREEPASALQIQRFYLDACRRFLKQRPEAPAEAWQVLQQWEETLDALEQSPESLVGVLDWPTKRFLMQRAGGDASWAQRKKIDLRYHELSPEGYFEMLKTTGMVSSVVEETDVNHARRNPPPATPAAVRSRYIREFSGGEEPLAVNWKYVFLGRGWGAKVIRLDRFLQPPSAAAKIRRAELSGAEDEADE